MINIILFTILFQPWFFIPNRALLDQFRVPQGLILDMMFMAIIALGLYKGNRFIYRNKYLSLLLGWAFLNFTYFFFFPFSLDVLGQGRMVNMPILEPMLHIILGVWALQVILSNIERDDFIRISKVLCFSATFLASFAILQRIGFDPLKMVHAQYIMQNQVSTCLGNPNLVGGYLALCFPLFLMFKSPKYAFGAIISLIAIIVSRCHFGVVLAVLSVMIFLFLKYRKNWITWVALGVFTIMGIALISHLDYAKLGWGMEGRFPCWQVGIEKLKDNVLFGQGFGIWKCFNVTLNKTVYTTLHNDWLERAVEFGLIGVVLMILVVINSFRNFSYEGETNYAYLSMFVIFLIMMIGSFPLEAPSLALLGFISFCAVEKL